MEVAYKLLTVEEFLDACPNDQRHYQLFDGVIVAMAPPGDRHQRIAGVLGGLLYNAVAVEITGMRGPDPSRDCPAGDARSKTILKRISQSLASLLADDRRGIVDQPLLIVEIPSLRDRPR